MKRGVFPVIVLLLAPRMAVAAPPKSGQAGSDPAAAESLFYEARTLMSRGQYTEACPKLEESLKLDEGIGTRFNLADCNEHIGKIATAWAGFIDVASQAKLAGQPDREKIARKRAQALESRLPKLVVEVDPAHEPSLEVRRDETVVGSAAWGTAIPVDPGTHKVTATAATKRPWESTVQVSEGRTTTVTIPRALPEAVAISVPVTGPAAVGGATPASTSPPGGAATMGAHGQVPADAASTTTLTSQETNFPPPVVEGTGKTQRTVGYVVGAAGIVGLGVGLGFGLRSLSKRNDADSHCSGNLCDQQGVDLRDQARNAGNVSTVTSIIGGAALVTGLVLVLTAPKDTAYAPSVGTASARAKDKGPLRVGSIQTSWHVSPTGGGILLQGALP